MLLEYNAQFSLKEHAVFDRQYDLIKVTEQN